MIEPRTSRRQQQIVSLIADGLTDKEIGQQLGISTHTVRTYIERLFHQLGCRTRTRAVVMWFELGRGPVEARG